MPIVFHRLIITIALFCISRPLYSENKELADYYLTLKEKPGAGYFLPPKDWILLDPNELPDSIVMIATKRVGLSVPPTLNLAQEPFSGDLEDYMRIIHEINKKNGYVWARLGRLHTDAGPAQLSRREIPTEWGAVRQLHMVCIHKGQAYIITATTLSQDFTRYAKEISESMRSFRVNSLESK